MGNAHIVLCNIHRFWQLERSRNQDLPLPLQHELKDLAKACTDALEKVERIREKHKDLNTSSNIIKIATGRAKFAMADFHGDISSARQALQQNTGNLALLHTMLT